MKKTIYLAAATILSLAPQAWSQGTGYTNFIRQVQYPSKLVHDMTGIAPADRADSVLAIDPGGARFELWTVKAGDPPTDFLLASTYVGTYTPVATLDIISEDTTSAAKRTRADRPFTVKYEVTGLRSGEDDPAASKTVDFFWHVQSYGEDGTGEGLDRNQATLMSSTSVKQNGPNQIDFQLTSVPGADRSKVRGEERFSIYSIEDNRPADNYYVPASRLASETIQIWPVADGSIDGITSGAMVRYNLPPITLTMNDLYPFSTTYAQAYPGNPQLGVEGRILPGSAFVWDDAVPTDKVLVVQDYAEALGADGVWTIELVTKTPFGIDRLAYVTFNLDRTMKVRASFHTIE